MTIPTVLPPMYAGWMDQLLGGQIPPETSATCSSCAMVVSDRTTDDWGFEPGLKCCTYLPNLWNFLVGRILLDDDSASAPGRASIEARIDCGVAVTPLGLGQSAPFRVLYEASGAPAFGQSRSMLCPHYLDVDGGLCGIWRHRESTCATFFCKFVRGAVGQQFWAQLHGLLRTAEQSIAGWTLLELGLESSALAHLYRPLVDPRTTELTAREMDGITNPAEVQATWGRWRGREREWYRECARLVSPLTWTDVLEIGGAKLAIHARIVREAYSRLMSDSVPDHPTVALVRITPRGRDRVRLATYSPTDALEVPAVVAAALPYFDGRPVAEALENVRQGEGVRVDPSLVRKLTDFGVLKDESVVR